MADGVDEPELASALAAERERGALVMARVRVVGVVSWFAINLALAVIGEPHARPSLAPLGGYALASLVIWLANRHSGRVRRVSLYAIALVDVPAFMVVAAFVQVDHARTPLAHAAMAQGIVLMFLAALQTSLRWTTLVAGALAGVVLQSWMLWRVGLFAELIPYVVLQTAGAAAAMLYFLTRTRALMSRVLAEHAARERLRRYFSPTVAATILAGEQPGDDAREVTLLFSDLRDFTTLAETLPAREVVELLNEVHAAMVDVVFSHGGTLDKFMGDGMMCYFGAPLSQPDHAACAVAAALDMQDRLGEVNSSRRSRGRLEVRMGIGIHTGRVIIGTIGADARREYTAIGDAVNVAARIEGLTKAQGEQILVSAATRDLAGDAFAWAAGTSAEIRGKREPVTVYVPRRRAAATTTRAV